MNGTVIRKDVFFKRLIQSDKSKIVEVSRYSGRYNGMEIVNQVIPKGTFIKMLGPGSKMYEDVKVSKKQGLYTIIYGRQNIWEVRLKE